jgi:hypothetical protein
MYVGHFVCHAVLVTRCTLKQFLFTVELAYFRDSFTLIGSTLPCVSSLKSSMSAYIILYYGLTFLEAQYPASVV